MIDLSSLLEKLEGEDMETKRKEIKLHFAKSLILCIRTIGRVFHYHLLMSTVVFFLLVFYWSFPSLFTFLVSSSPVIVCTTLLLGLLLSYGELNIPEIEEERIWDDGCMDIVSSTNYRCVQETENLSIGNHVDSNEDELQLRETEIQEEKDIVDVDNYQTTKPYEENKKPDALMIKISSGEEVKQESYVLEDVLNQELQGQCFYSYRNLCVDEVGGVTEMGKNAIPFCIANQQETENSNLEIHKPALDHHFDSPLGLPCQSVEDHHAPLDGESDGTESCSPDVALDDIIPMLDELHTILNSDLPEHTSIAKLDAISEQTLVDHETDNNIIAEKDGEAQEAKDDGSDAAGKWTEGDRKSVMDLGSSELERDRRLESLIAKRRARKNLTFRMERNLSDLDENDSLLHINELSRFRIQVPSRRNPFDMFYDSRETMDLPPVPGSAPSLLPRKSLFDVFYDQQDQNSSLDVRNCDWDFVSPSHHETLFRSDTFRFGRRHFQQERYNSRLKPYFTSERDLEGDSTFNRQFSEKSQAKVSDISDSDTVSSAICQEYQRDLEKLDVSRQVELSSLAKQDTEAEDHETPYEAEPDDTEEGKCEHRIKDVYDYKIAEPIYDSSPPASGNSLYKESAFDEALQDSGQLGDADSSLEFNMRMDSVNVSTPRALEIAVASEIADFISNSANIEESGSISTEPSTSSGTSVSNDEKVRTKEFDDINQYDDAKIGKSATQEDSSDLASSVIQEMQTAQCVNDPNVFPLRGQSKELHQIYMDGTALSSVAIFLSDGSVSSEFQKGLPLPFVHVDVDECQSSMLGLPSISEENQEHLEQKEDNLSCTDVLSSSRELSSDHQVELMVHKDDWYEDIISDSKSSFEHDFSLSKDRSSLIVDTLDNQFSKDSFGMPQEVDSEINQTETVGAQILSPLGSEGNNEEIVCNPMIHFLETILVREVDSESSQLSEEDIGPRVLELDIDKPPAAELLQSSEIGTTQQTVSQSMTDSELTVIEARLIEEIHSYVKKFIEESPNKHVPQFTTDSELPVIEEARRSNEESPRKRIYQTIEESELSVVEARTDEGIHLYFEQSGEDRESKPIHHDDGSQYSHLNVDMDTKLRKSDLHVVEAKSIEDIDMAYSQLSHSTSKESLETIKTGVLEVRAFNDISLDLKEHFAAQTGSSIETGNVGEKNQEKIKY